MSKDRYYREEEHFHERDRKQFKKERRQAQETDRSKFKKTDLDQLKKEETPSPDDPRLQKGRVVAITGEGAWVDVGERQILCTLKGLMKKEKMQAKNLIAVGDLVLILPSEGTIVYVEPRYSTLSRQDISGNTEQLIAANIDQVLIVGCVVNPHLKPALIDRYLISAEKGGMHPIIVINKIDLLDDHAEEKERYLEFLAAYEPLGIPVLSVSIHSGAGIENLSALMKNKTSVFAGQSGVGKSSLLNAAFGFTLKTGELAHKTHKGSHTTTTARLLSLPDGGYCIDTPGIRSFGIWNLQKEDLIHHFKEFSPFSSRCRYANCNHLLEPQCAVRQGVEEGKIARIRYESHCALMEEIVQGIDQRTKRRSE